MTTLTKLTRKEIIQLFHDYMEADAELTRATFRCGVSPSMVKKRDELAQKVTAVINSEL